MLIGNYQTKLNAKNRTALPKKFRQKLGDQLIITLGYENCLIIVSPQSWAQLVNPDKPFILDAARETDRFLMGNAFEISLDEQGRFIIPLALKQFAQLENEVIFVGVGNRVEIWAVKKWQAYQDYLQKNNQNIAEKLRQELP